ncbi:hypothetical protein [Vibrio alginolyticus]|uniref:hypothetical protein n=1 Tax=Vibrio alginolyticus TaxID=663 RepID=UPI0006CA6231|nr:hypothetical protein [Vibrio alginolyticus]KPM98519.1 hypothetical protein AOG25_08735 [Vibrio alginolyticus]CAH7148107.1 conserved hypothetical protein [Vibrio chagasii]CAH7318867.1 conserved hypothetical protein [Vibrio chagasii]
MVKSKLMNFLSISESHEDYLSGSLEVDAQNELMSCMYMGVEKIVISQRGILFSDICSQSVIDTNCDSIFKSKLVDAATLTIGRNTYEVFPTNSEITLSNISDGYMDNLSSRANERFEIFRKELQIGSGLFVLSGKSNSGLPRFKKTIENDLVGRNISVASMNVSKGQVSGFLRVGETCNQIADGLSVVDFLQSPYASLPNCILLSCDLDSESVLFAAELVRRGKMVLLVANAASSIHAISTVLGLLSQSEFMTYFMGAMGVGVVPSFDDIECQLIPFSSDSRFDYWSFSGEAPTRDSFVKIAKIGGLEHQDVRSNIYVAELTRPNRELTEFIEKGMRGSQLIKQLSLIPRWTSIFDEGARMLSEKRTTLNHLDFCIGRC